MTSSNRAVAAPESDTREPSRFTWEEMRSYWHAHSTYWADLDYERDPDGLSNVLYAGVPLWMNQYFARMQALAFRKLLAQLPVPAPGARALDVGCGTGRWTRLLAEQGYEMVGIDLQPHLIELNRRRYPHISFTHASVQEYSVAKPFDLISAVTVIQHIPFSEQHVAIRQMRRLTKERGHVLILENVRDQAPHVFSNPIAGWRARFAECGFACVAVQRYHYSPFIRSQWWVARQIKSIGRNRSAHEASWTPEQYITHLSGGRASAPRGVRKAMLAFGTSANALGRRIAVAADSLIEPALIRTNLAAPTVHCGFLFKAV